MFCLRRQNIPATIQTSVNFVVLRKFRLYIFVWLQMWPCILYNLTNFKLFFRKGDGVPKSVLSNERGLAKNIFHNLLT